MPDYIDVLLLETPDGHPAVVTAPMQAAAVHGDIVRFSGGEHGIVKASECFDRNGAAYLILCSAAPVYEANAIYRTAWEKEKQSVG